MDKHITRLAVADIITGVIHLVVGLSLIVWLNGEPFMFGNVEKETFRSVMASLASLMFIISGFLSIVAGAWMFTRVPLSRFAGLSAAFLLLIVFPLGTAVGSYGIWVLFQNGIEARFARRGGVAAHSKTT